MSTKLRRVNNTTTLNPLAVTHTQQNGDQLNVYMVNGAVLTFTKEETPGVMAILNGDEAPEPRREPANAGANTNTGAQQ